MERPQGMGVAAWCVALLAEEKGANRRFAVRERVRWGKPGGLSLWFFG